MKFPPEIDKATGRFKMVSAEESVKESIYIILMTQKGERWIHPLFGSNTMSYAFTDISVTRLNMMSRELRTDILGAEPRVDEVDVNITPNLAEGTLIVDIRYHITDTDVYDNMVFPFYLNLGNENEGI
ncbi:hypothetical protein SAMN05216390_10553 [Lachnospiraceae bacterium KH1T2]|nr:hypothetical protein SAMN05216390_10553 [Lachnospiraceae bacterium KH1T2]